MVKEVYLYLSKLGTTQFFSLSSKIKAELNIIIYSYKKIMSGQLKMKSLFRKGLKNRLIKIHEIWFTGQLSSSSIFQKGETLKFGRILKLDFIEVYSAQ